MARRQQIHYEDYIFPIGLLALGYYALKNILAPGGGLPGQTSTLATSQCPRGPSYRTEIWKDCDPGYIGSRGFWGSIIPFSPQDCTCQAVPPAPTITANPAPQPIPGALIQPGIVGVSAPASQILTDLARAALPGQILPGLGASIIGTIGGGAGFISGPSTPPPAPSMQTIGGGIVGAPAAPYINAPPITAGPNPAPFPFPGVGAYPGLPHFP